MNRFNFIHKPEDYTERELKFTKYFLGIEKPVENHIYLYIHSYYLETIRYSIKCDTVDPLYVYADLINTHPNRKNKIIEKYGIGWYPSARYTYYIDFLTNKYKYKRISTEIDEDTEDIIYIFDYVPDIPSMWFYGRDCSIYFKLLIYLRRVLPKVLINYIFSFCYKNIRVIKYKNRNED